MNNAEKHMTDILAKVGFGVADEKVINCFDECREKGCIFAGKGSCQTERRKWLKQEYPEPSVDWAKVSVDTPILVKDSENGEWIHRYFAKYENGLVYAWESGATSWSVPNTNHLTDWKFAKLVKRGDKR